MNLQMRYKNLGPVKLLIFCLFIFFLLPFVNLDSLIDPELMPRFLCTSIFMIICSVYYIVSGKYAESLDGTTFKIFGTLFIILVWTAFSLIWSINLGDAFAEWLRLSVLYGFLFISFQLFRQTKDAAKYICRSAIFAVLIFSFYGFTQILSALPEYNNAKNFMLANVASSTLSNKNFFSEVLVLLLPFLVNGLISDIRRWKYGFAAVTLLDLVWIIFLQTTAAWLAVLSSLIFFIIFSKRAGVNILNYSFNRKSSIIVIIAILAAISSGYILFRYTVNYKSLKSKIDNVSEYVINPSLISSTRLENNNSVFERLLIWRNSMRMIADYPLVGAGLNNWKIYNPSYGIGGTQFTNSGMLNYEHPHNDYLLIWAEQGPVGIGLYIFLFLLIGRAGLRKLRTADRQTKIFVLLLLCGMLSFSVLSFFAYPRSRFYEMILLMIIFAMILALSPEAVKNKINTKYILIIILAVSMLGALAAYKRADSEIHVKNTIIAQVNKNFSRMLREANGAYSWYYPLDLTATPISWYKGMALFYNNDINGAVTEYEKAILVNPNHIRVINDLATSYERNKEPEKAIYYYRKSLSMIPLFIEGNLNLSAAYFNINKIDSAFYYIDRIYAMPMSMSESNNYNKFLDAILNAKAYQAAVSTNDSAVMKKMLPVIENKDSLRLIYDSSKQQNQEFVKYLLIRDYSIEK